MEVRVPRENTNTEKITCKTHANSEMQRKKHRIATSYNSFVKTYKSFFLLFTIVNQHVHQEVGSHFITCALARFPPFWLNLWNEADLATMQTGNLRPAWGLAWGNRTAQVGRGI